ncbi:MAG: hypothetical protein ACJA1L_000037 [Paracoccaceae bacterium]|jgi:hypothetical protein
MARKPAKGRQGRGADPDAPELPLGPLADDPSPRSADADPIPRPAPKPPRKRAAGTAAGKSAGQTPNWPRLAAIMLLAVCAIRLAVNALGAIPVHFDEAQYWVYGEAFDYGYFSKPPLVAWLIRGATDVLGNSLFALRLFAPLSHLAVGALVYAIGARLYGARIGFWAAAFYTAGPGVVVSAMLMTTDPVMMIGWGIAMYAFLRAVEPTAPVRGARPPMPPRLGWWALAGLGLGAGMMAKYTAAAVVIGALGYLRLSVEQRHGAGRRGPLLALGLALAVLSPNLIWNATHGFATITHLGDNAEIGTSGPWLRPGKLLEFLGAQLAVIGPVAAVAGGVGLLAPIWRPALRRDWRWRFLAWFAAPLLALMTVQALRAGANANWAAPAWIAGCVIAAQLMDGARWAWARIAQVAVGAVTALALLLAAGLYDIAGTTLPRFYDPFKKMRNGGPFCEIALAGMETEGADALLLTDRRRLAECMFLGELTMQEVAIVNEDGHIDNHFEMAAPLRPGDDRAFVLIAENAEQAEALAAGFEEAEFIGEGGFATHADRAVSWVMWRLEGRKAP